MIRRDSLYWVMIGRKVWCERDNEDTCVKNMNEDYSEFNEAKYL